MIDSKEFKALIERFSRLDANRPPEGLVQPKLASYVPFVGQRYPWGEQQPRRPRVVFYGMAQNLAGHATEANAYAESPDMGAMRLQATWAGERTTLGIRPWQTLHAQILVCFGLRALEIAGLKRSTGCVTSNAAFTNYVKWSYQSKTGTDLNPPRQAFQYARQYVEWELDMLKPDLVIAMGQKVGDAFGADSRVVQVRHSSPQVTNVLRGVSRDLENGQPLMELEVNRDALISRWFKELDEFRFRLGQPDRPTIEVGVEALHDLLRKDWLYYLLAEKQIRAHTARLSFSP